MSKVLQTRQGRCGEYANVLFQLAQALGWRARLVVDWTDHLWVEVLLPVEAPPPAAATASGRREAREARPFGRASRRARRVAARRRRADTSAGYRWVHLDPCEAAVDTPMLYAEWGKLHTFVIAIGHGRIIDVTPDYARDLNATLQARDLSPDELRRALARVRLVCKPP